MDVLFIVDVVAVWGAFMLGNGVLNKKKFKCRYLWSGCRYRAVIWHKFRVYLRL